MQQIMRQGPSWCSRVSCIQLLLVFSLFLSFHLAGAKKGCRGLQAENENQNDNKATGNLLVDIFRILWMALFNFWSFLATRGSQCETTRCGFGGLLFVSHTGIPGTMSCQEMCTIFPVQNQCGVCSRSASTIMPAPTVLALPPTMAPVPSTDVTVQTSSPTMAPVPFSPVDPPNQKCGVPKVCTIMLMQQRAPAAKFC